MSIRQLPDDVVGRIRSSTLIVSLNGVARGLLKNALDSGAIKVNITIDYSRGSCTVEDNGCGIPSHEFKDDGGLGKLHHTSKYPPDDKLHGSHGDFLASLANLSLLSVASHHHSDVPHSSIVIHNSRVIARYIPAPVEQRLRTFQNGTRVMVRDLFGLMPVRVKQRPVATTDQTSTDKDWSQLVRDFVALLMAWPNPISVSLQEAVGQRWVRLRSPDNTDTLHRVSGLLIQASLVDSSDVKSLVPILASTRHVQVSGCVSTKPVATRRAQFISFGVQPLVNDGGTNLLYEEINKIFADSSFSVVETDAAEPGYGTSGKERSSRRRAERWPMFYLLIRLRRTQGSHDVDDILENRNNNLSAILDLLKSVCYEFLKKYHLRPHKVRMSKDQSCSSTSSRPVKRPRTRSWEVPDLKSVENSTHPQDRSALDSRIPDFQSPFDGLQRIKIGHATSAQQGSSDREALSSNQYNRLVGEGGRLLRKPFGDTDDKAPEDPPLQQSPHFKRTGIFQGGDDENEASDNTRLVGTSNSETQPAILRTSIAKQGDAEPSAWLQNVLRSWSNPIFQNAPPSIPRLYNKHHTSRDDGAMGIRSKFFGAEADSGTMFESASVRLEGRISKSALAHVQVIAQVDRKFILVKMPLSDSKTTGRFSETASLVMLDQHAVDERCRLEDLMANYFVRDDGDGVIQANVELLEKPVQLEATDQEVYLLQKHYDYFASWGVIYKVVGPTRTGTAHVEITGLPPSIIERCRNEPQLAKDLIQAEVWELSESGRLPQAPFLPFVSEDSWISNFHRCPKGILDLLNSRSCRSAIMFNDVLSKDECVALLERLSRCAFPFQCAHGRPSMAPLLDLGVGSRVGGWDEEGETVAWEKWTTG